MTANLRIVLLFLSAIALPFFGAPSARALVFNVADGDIAGLKAAISTSSGDNQDDTIELATNGTYVLTTPDNYVVGLNGLPVILTDGGHQLIIHGNGAVLQRSTAPETAAFRILLINYGTNVTISELTVANGHIGQAGSSLNGGAIYVYNSTSRLTIRNCVFSGNTAGVMGGSGYGGAIYTEGTVVVENSTLSNNSADSGGGIYNRDTHGVAKVTVTNSLFTGNSANRAGAIYNEYYGGQSTESALVAISNCTFVNNSAFSGGVIFNEVATTGGGTAAVTIDRSTLRSNYASSGGGAIFNWGTSVIVNNSTIDSNTAADSGGGIYNYSFGLVKVTGCTLIANSAPKGGAIYNNTVLKVLNCTLADNSATNGDGIYNYDAQFSGNVTATIAGSILKSSVSGQHIYNLGGIVTSQGYNLSNDNGAGFLTAAGDQINTDPMLDPAGLQDNGGPTQTIALLQGSPAIDKGINNGTTIDQRGVGYVRTIDDPSIPAATGGDNTDIGAFEFGARIPTVSRKIHGAASTFDVDLPLGGNSGVECRSGGATNDHQLVLTFPSPVTVNGSLQAQVTSGIGLVGAGGTSNGGAVTISGSNVTVPLTNVANAQAIKVTLFNVSDGTNTNDVNIPMRVLLGDTNGNGTVNASDVGQTKAQIGHAITNSNFRNDLNVNGTINSSDVSIVKSQLGTSVPVAPQSEVTPDNGGDVKMAR